MSPRWADDTSHPLVAGIVLGSLLARGLDAETELAPEDERRPGDDFLPSILLTTQDLRWRITIEPADFV